MILGFSVGCVCPRSREGNVMYQGLGFTGILILPNHAHEVYKLFIFHVLEGSELGP